MWVFSVFAMLAWSGSDLFSKVGSRQSDKYSHLKMGVAVGLIMGANALYSVLFCDVPFSLDAMLFYLPASLLYMGSMLLGYLALRYIELSVSSPICNTSGALALLLSILYFGVKWQEDESDRIYLNAPILVGVALIFVGVVSLGIVEYTENDEARELRQAAGGHRYTKSWIALLLPILYCVLDAFGTFADTLLADRYAEKLLEETPSLSPEAADTLTASVLNASYGFTWLLCGVLMAVFLLFRRQKPELRYDGAKLLGGVCETVGQFFYMAVVVSEYKIGLVVISAYCAISLLWSRLFLKEKLSLLHYLAIGAAFAGIVILGVYDI